MNITFLMCGKTSEKWISDGMDTYLKRLRNYMNVDVKVLPDLKKISNLSQKEVKILEEHQIIPSLTPSDYVIILDEHGHEYTSLLFADELQKLMNSGRKNVVFVIGGPYGFSEAMHQRSDKMISLSQMTFSHQMVRVIFLEQLYRAFTIIHNEPYHHE